MAVKIRMKRMGSKKRPFYRVVVADSRAPRDGRFIEELGYYNPIDENKTFSINAERVAYWMGTGAKPSETVEKLLRKNGILEGKTVKSEKKEDTERVEEAMKEQDAVLPETEASEQNESTDKEVEEKEDAVKPEESTHDDKVDAEEVIEAQKDAEQELPSVGGDVDPEKVAKEADTPNPDPSTEEVIEQDGDKADPEEIVEENEKH